LERAGKARSAARPGDAFCELSPRWTVAIMILLVFV
jgi:hypothetical protein